MNRVGISIGNDCTSVGWAVKNGIRKLKEQGHRTCPFDIMVSNYGGIVRCIYEDFKNFTNPEFLEIRDSCVYNSYYHFNFNHEGPGHANLYITEAWPGGIGHFTDNNFALFIERYERRIQNFRDYINDPGNHIIFTYSGVHQRITDFSELTTALFTKYPKLDYEIINIGVQEQPSYILCFTTVRPSAALLASCEGLNYDVYVLVDDDTYRVPLGTNSHIKIIRLSPDLGLDMTANGKALFYFCNGFQRKRYDYIWFIDWGKLQPGLIWNPSTIDCKYGACDLLEWQPHAKRCSFSLMEEVREYTRLGHVIADGLLNRLARRAGLSVEVLEGTKMCHR